MRLEAHIALRYLLGKKSHNAINIVSGVSAASVMIVTAALVCVLSVLNGFSLMVEDMFSAFDSPLLVQPVKGKTLRYDTEEMESVRRLPEVAIVAPTIEETAMIQYKDKQAAATIKGVTDDYQAMTHIDSLLTDGFYSTWDGAFDRCVMGRGIAAQIGINAHFVGGLKVYAPKRKERVNLMRPDKSLNHENMFIAGTFAVNQMEYDDQYILTSIELAERLFDYPSGEATAIQIALKEGVNLQATKRQIGTLLGNEYRVMDQYEQQEGFYNIMRIEKVLTGLLLVFILLIASFNIVGSLSMLMMDKQTDIQVLRNLGATPAMIQRVFLYEGWLISLLGSGTGLILGLAICLSQQHWGWLKLGDGTDYVISSYPVQVQTGDILTVAIAVMLIGLAAAAIPVRKMGKSNKQ